MMGAALLQELTRRGYSNLVGVGEHEPELTDGAHVDAFFSNRSPDYVFLVAGKSGGIAANQTLPADLMIHNLVVGCNIIRAAHEHGVKRLLYLASSCCYPRDCPQPMREDHLVTGPFEPTNEAYATAKLAGIKLCQAYRQQYGANFVSAIPANIFGPGDDFSYEESHVIPALIRRMHEAKANGADAVTIWGSGAPRREFLFVEDLADACIFVMDRVPENDLINLGSRSELSISDLASMIKELVGYSGNLRYDTSRPDGAPLKAVDSSKLAQLGWQPRTELRHALQATYAWFLKNEANLGAVSVL